MRNKTELIAGSLGAAMVLAVAIVFGVTHYQALFHRGSNQVANATVDAAGQLTFPTIEEMCRAAGVGSAGMAGCVNDENSAQEFVGAWLGLNGFLTNGRIDIEQIQLAAELSVADPTVDPPAGDPLDPLDAQDALGPDGLPPQALPPDPSDPLTVPGVADHGPSAAQTAQYCLTVASDDWIKLHDCIAHNDPSSTLDGN
jgi:hypothetical protein